MPMQWNEQADAKLFANVLKLHVVKLDYQALAKSMGVTPKAISHRISKIKEKAQVRRVNWENYSNPATLRKRGLKGKSVDDDDGMTRKRVKAEQQLVVKAEESPCNVDRVAGQYGWDDGWQQDGGNPGQQFYALYRVGDSKVDMGSSVDCGGGNDENPDNDGFASMGARDEVCGDEGSFVSETVVHGNEVV